MAPPASSPSPSRSGRSRPHRLQGWMGCARPRRSRIVLVLEGCSLRDFAGGGLRLSIHRSARAAPQLLVSYVPGLAALFGSFGRSPPRVVDVRHTVDAQTNGQPQARGSVGPKHREDHCASWAAFWLWRSSNLSGRGRRQAVAVKAFVLAITQSQTIGRASIPWPPEGRQRTLCSSHSHGVARDLPSSRVAIARQPPSLVRRASMIGSSSHSVDEARTGPLKFRARHGGSTSPLLVPSRPFGR